MTVGERIRQRRIDLGMTQEELARRAGYKSRSSINKIELSRDLPLHKIRKVAAALDMTPAELAGWEDEPQQTITTISNKIEAIDGGKDTFMEDFMKDEEFMEHIRLLYSLPREKRRSVYDTIKGLYYIDDMEHRKKGKGLEA